MKIRLTPETILCCGSADGKTWSQDWEVKRGAAHAGAPQWLMLGNGSQNVHPQHFSPASGTASFFSDLLVGRE